MGYFPMPRLAGQQPEYIEAQLRAFIERRRTNPIMFNVAHVLSPSMIDALAAHFRKIFEEGLPESNVPACSACHGTEGKGQNEIPPIDRLEEGARSGHGGRHFRDHGTDSAQSDEITD
jgi:cytochrome c553